MEIILLTGRASKSRKINLGLSAQLGIILLFAIILSSVGYLAGSQGASTVVNAQQVAETKKEVESLKLVLSELEQKRAQMEMDNYIAQADAELLSKKVGEINAQIIRLNAFGERLAGLAKIDKDEFAFDADPARGGAFEEVKTISSTQVNADEFAESLRVLQQKIDGKQQQLDYLQRFFLRDKVDNKTKISGRPIKKGWISSYFGKRKDPFTGKTAFHSGIDLAGKKGSDIVAAADGIVTWSGKRWAYGQMVEIDHGKGITTRYAHNDSHDVKVGELVKKGQVIAKMGSSGRSTGPHLHFEVRKNGKAVNPLKYIR